MFAMLIFLALVFAVSLIAKRMDGSIITGPMVFAFAGVGYAWLAPSLAGHFSIQTAVEIRSPTLLAIGEVSLAIILFGDATRISLREALAKGDLPARLLLIGMPFTILLGAIAGVWLFHGVIPFWEAAILATILAPTDASLGAVVVNSPRVPQRIREALSVESGLNDGLSMPFFVLFLALAGYELHGRADTWLQFTLMQIGVGALTGFFIGWIGGKLMQGSEKRGWMYEGTHLVAFLALAILAWGVADALGGNGFIAAFVAGAFLRLVYNEAINYAEDFEASWAHLLVYFVFYLFGMMAAPWLTAITPTVGLYALLSLTLIRMVPVAISLIGMKLRPGSVAFMGWFGPRGLASVVLGLIYLEQLSESRVNEAILITVIATVMLSIVLHGVSAAPLSRLYARYLSKFPSESPDLA